MNKPIAVSSVPTGAEVTVDGRSFGITPLTLTTNDVMPDRVTDGRPSARAILSIEKAGYERFQVILREFGLPDAVMAVLKPTGIEESFENYLDNNPLLNSATLPARAPLMQTSADLDGDSERLYGQGYLLIAYSGFTSDALPADAILAKARDVSAAVVLRESRFSGELTAMKPVQTQTSGGVTTSVATGHSTDGINSTSFRVGGFTILPARTTTQFVPFAKRQYAHQVTYWRKRRANVLQVYCDPLPDTLRRDLQRNTGAYVIGMEDGGPAFLANILIGDVITSVNAVPVNTPVDLDNASAAASGRTISVGVIREGNPLQISVVLGPATQ